jgi:DNA (cytosine-5)-methyltransferase 1
VGVDINPQPNYPFEFIQADVTEASRFALLGFDLIHASPPCQHSAAITKGTNKHRQHLHPDLFPQVRALLERSGKPYVIENPDSRPDVVLCGEMFGLKVIRHRRFELGGWTAAQPQHIKHRGPVIGMRHGRLVTEEEGRYYQVYGSGGYKGTVAQWQEAMGIDWTAVRREIAEAIPPAYTQYIGQQFLAQQGEQAA